MPLRDHFRPPVADVERWETIHTAWIFALAQHLNRHVLSRRFHSVVVMHVVTERRHNLHAELLRALHLEADAPLLDEDLYAVCYRTIRPGQAWQLDVWPYPLALGAPLPTVPLWLTDELAVPLECELTYEDVCAGFRLP